MTSPSLGIKSPISTSTRSPALSATASTRSNAVDCASWIRFARISVRVRRRASAWALPRPSATASAKFANSTVNHSQIVICPENRALLPTTLPPPTIKSRIKNTVVSTETISTQNMTGFLTRVRGSSFLKDAQIAGTIKERWNNDIGRRLRLARPPVGRLMMGVTSVILVFLAHPDLTARCKACLGSSRPARSPAQVRPPEKRSVRR